MAGFVSDNKRKLNEDKKIAFESIISSTHSKIGNRSFLDAPGVTPLLVLVWSKLRQNQNISLTVALSGRDAAVDTQLICAASNGLWTLQKIATCNISCGTRKANILTACKLIIWKETRGGF